MVCPKCKSEITEDTDFCGICGAKLTDGVFDEPEMSETGHRHKRELHKQSRHNFIKKLKIAGIAALGVAAAVVIIIVVSSIRTSEGRRISDNVPLGRNIDIVNSDTGALFIRTAQNSFLPQISTFSYILEAEETLTVDGIKLPEWAIMLSADSSDNIYKVTYYDFSALGKSWKGAKKTIPPDTDAVEYGSKIADAQRVLGLRPYAIVTTRDDNTQKLVYRCHAEDDNGNTRVYNINLFVNEADGTVKDVSMTEAEYIPFFFSVG
jgi:hypothetical protein